jgi:AcrR family transcriptional regulator
VAAEEFVKYGYENCNMNRIAKAAGSTKPTIYRLYASKELLFQTVITKALEDNSAHVPDFRDDPRPPSVVLTEVARQILVSYSSGAITGLWRAVVSVSKQFPDLHRHALEVITQRSISARLAGYFQALTERGVLKIDHPAMAARHFAMLIGSASMFLDPSKPEYSEEERIKEVVGLFMRGYAPEQYAHGGGAIYAARN